MSRCRSCSARIIWAITEKGKRIPVDAEPAVDGNLRLISSESPPREHGRPPFVPPHAIVAGATIDLLDPTDDGTRYMPHHATCPQADDWRKK